MTKRRIMTSITVIALICFAIISAGCSGTDTEQNNQANAASSSISQNPKAHTQMLLDSMMSQMVANDKAWEDASLLIRNHVRNHKEEGVLWNPEGIKFSTDEIEPNLLFHGFEKNIPENSFYAGPVVFWWREEPEGEIFYETYFSVYETGITSSWREKPYEYGIETYADPPSEVIKVLSDNNVKLIY